MLESLEMIFNRLLEQVSLERHRFLYHQFNLTNRLTGLVGPRGVGKTTMMLQYIKAQCVPKETVFYFSADHIHFQSTTVYEFVEQLFLKRSIDTFFIDEIHKYKNWSQELKNLYDGFPTLKIVFSGSSSLDLVKGSYDLSRRAKMYYLPGLSFREYLNFLGFGRYECVGFDDLLNGVSDQVQEFSKLKGLLGHYHTYLKQGFYPFFQEDPLSYYEKILAVVEKTIYEDISNYYNLKTGNLRYFKKILNYLATIPPGNVSTYNIGKNLGIDDKTAASYLSMLEQAGLVDVIYPAESGNLGLRKPEKVFFNNTNLHYAIAGHLSNNVEIGTVRELAFIQATRNAGLEVHYNKQGDYEIQKTVFEIGGKSKTREQIKHIKNAFLVKDDVVSSLNGAIPLVYFGLLY